MNENKDDNAIVNEADPQGEDASLTLPFEEQPVEGQEGPAESAVEDNGAGDAPETEKPVVKVSVPNPKREVDYTFSLIDQIGEEKVIAIRTSDDAGDLVFDEVSKALSGRPQTSRDFWMEIETSQIIYRVDCFINENPRLLWNDIPSDQVVKPDKDYQAMLWPNLEMVAASHRGRSHAHRGTYRDDDFFIDRVGPFTLSIVADGAGSAQFSSIGSKVFCREAGAHFAELVRTKGDALLEVLNRMAQNPTETDRDPELMSLLYEILPATALYGRKTLMALASDNGMPLRNYHTTSLISLTVQVNPESYFCAVFQVGDGIITVLAGQQMAKIGEADSGEFSGETVFVTSSGVFDDANELLKRVHYHFSPSKPIVISMTDGITDSYFANNPKLDNLEIWQKLLSEVTDDEGRLKSAREICDWLNYYVEGSHDDRTISIIVYK